MKRSLLCISGALGAVAGFVLSAPTGWAAGTAEDWTARIKAVGNEGQGNAAASAAWKELSRLPVAELPKLVSALDGANDLAANWLRAAVDSVVDRALASKEPVPVAALGEYLADIRNHPKARRLAFEIIRRVDPATAELLVPGFLADPVPDLRRDAVQRLLDLGTGAVKKGAKEQGALLLGQAFQSAREADQVQALAESLAGLGRVVDLPRHFGWLTEWQVVGPFDNTGRKGFDQVFEPERGVDLGGTYPGKSGQVTWKPLTSEDPFGMVDINKVCGSVKEVTAYAVATYNSPAALTAEIRLGCKNAWKLWVNGRFIFGRDEYHRGAEIDQYRFPVQLKAGSNQILVKLCQNEQTEDWTKEWEFQLRICDVTGTAILATDRKPTPAAALKLPEKRN